MTALRRLIWSSVSSRTRVSGEMPAVVRIRVVLVGPMPWMYVRATSTRFSRGMSTPAIRAMPLLPLPLLVLGNDADDHDDARALDHLAALATRLDRWRNLHLILYVMRPRVRSYGDSS